MSRTLEDILTDVYNGVGVNPDEQNTVLVALGPAAAAQYNIYPNETVPQPPAPQPAPAKAPKKGGKQ